MNSETTVAQSIDEDARRRFESAWRDGKPEPIERFLPPQDHSYYLPTLEELVHIEIEFTWKTRNQDKESGTTVTLAEPPRVEHYLSRFPRLNQPGILLNLLQQEYLLRHRHGDRPSTDEYRQRFPQVVVRGDEIESLVKAQTLAPEPPRSGMSPGASLGRYRLSAVHAQGGFGFVWRAEDEALGREVAIKELNQRLARLPAYRKRFVAEARIAAQLEHPGVVPVYDLGGVDDEHPFYAMKLVGGQTFKEAIRRFHEESKSGSERAVEHLRLLDAFLAVARTMAFAHARGVIHRDLKPENIIVGGYGETVILDWGLAKVLSQGLTDPYPTAVSSEILPHVESTQAGTVLGTPSYMSPEQAAGQVDKVDHRSDIYGLGTILYQLLTGRRPFQGDTSEQVIDQVLAGAPPPPRAANPAIPRALEAICLKAMAKRQEDRYQEVFLLVRDLERHLADEPVSVYAEPITAKLGRWARRHRTSVVSGCVALFLLLGVAVAGLFLWQEAQQRRLQEEQRQLREATALASAAEADLESARAELRADRFSSAEKFLRKGLHSLGDKPGFDDLRFRLKAGLDQVQRLEQFYHLSDDAEKLAFMEYDELALAACAGGLRELRVFEQPKDWWLHLPADDLHDHQFAKLKRDAYRQLLLLSALRVKEGLLSKGAEATKAYQSALEPLEMVRLFQKSSGESGESFAGRMLENFCFLNLGQFLKIKRPASPEPTTAADCYFWGIANLWVGAVPENDPTSVALQMGGRLMGLDFSGAPARSEQALRKAAALEPQHYWAHFWLGWSLMAPLFSHKADPNFKLPLDDLKKVELAFNTCIALRPDFAFAYSWRAQVLLLQVRQTTDAKIKEELRQRAIHDLNLAAKFGDDDPWIQNLLMQSWWELGDRPKLLHACGRALDLEAPLEFWRGRRNYEEKQSGLTSLREYARWMTQQEANNPDAWAALAHAYLFFQQNAEALQMSEQALKLRDSHPRALAVRGMVHLRSGKLGLGSQDIKQALASGPKNYLAAAGLARVQELQDNHEEALASYSQLEAIAVTRWQEIEALLGQARLLEKLGRTDAAAAALAKARRIKPSIPDAKASPLFPAAP